MMKTALWALTAMTACSATAVAQNESQRKLVCTYTLGEILDEGSSANKITKKVVNFYDKQGRATSTSSTANMPRARATPTSS